MRIEGSKEAFPMPIIHSGAGKSEAEPVRKKSNVEKIVKESKKAAQVQEARKERAEEEIFRQIKDANDKLKIYDRRLEFSIHDETHQIMVKVIDTTEDRVIREIPSEKALDMLAYVWKLTGILLDEKR